MSRMASAPPAKALETWSSSIIVPACLLSPAAASIAKH
jgi:hypothetical protein